MFVVTYMNINLQASEYENIQMAYFHKNMMKI